MGIVMDRVWRWAAFPALLALPMGLGCAGFFPDTNSGGDPPPTNTSDFAYVTSSYSNSGTTAYTLTGFSVGTGTLTKLSGFPLTLPFAPAATAINPSNTYLYVSGGGVIYGYVISSTGALTSITNSQGSAVLMNANVVSMDFSPDGQWLFGLDANGMTIDEYQILSGGLLTVETGAAYNASNGQPVVPNSIRVSQNSTNLYVAVALGTGGDLLYTLNTSTGAMTLANGVVPPTASSADQAVAFDSAGTTLYVARSGTDAGLVPYAIGSGSKLTAVSGAPYAVGSGPSSIVLDATGKYVYVGNKVSGTISGFSIGSGGALTALAGSPYASGAGLASLGRDNSGKYILAAAMDGGPDVQMYSFDATTAGMLDTSGTASTGDPTEPAGANSIALMH
jgi:6-phosphogluconolactonase